MSESIHRRQFLKRAALAAAVPLLFGCQKSKSRWRFFSEIEAQLVEQITAQIIPTDDDAGAVEAGCLNFIDRQLAGEYRRFQEAYRNGLAHLQKTCAVLYERSFAELSWDERTGLLESMENGQVPHDLWTEVSPQRFFSLIRDHTLQGFYGSPRHGGNKNYVSYRMLGLDYPHIIGQNRYTQGMDKPNGWEL